MGFLHQSPEFFHAERGDLLATWAAAVVGIDLNPVCAHARLLAHRLQDFGDARGFLGPFGQNHVLGITVRSGTIAGSGHDGLGGH